MTLGAQATTGARGSILEADGPCDELWGASIEGLAGTRAQDISIGPFGRILMAAQRSDTNLATGWNWHDVLESERGLEHFQIDVEQCPRGRKLMVLCKAHIGRIGLGEIGVGLFGREDKPGSMIATVQTLVSRLEALLPHEAALSKGSAPAPSAPAPMRDHAQIEALDQARALLTRLRIIAQIAA